HGRSGEVGAIGSVVGARWYEFDGVAAEHGEVAVILLPSGQIPSVIGVALGAIAELVSAQRVFGGRSHIQVIVHGHTARAHLQLTEQSADAEQDAPGIMADDINYGARSIPPNAKLVTL